MAVKTVAVLHYPNLGAPPQGIWWWDGGPRLASFYTDKDLRAIGAERMGHVAGFADANDIEDFFDRLEDSYPRPSVWKVVMLGDMTAPEYLRFEKKQFKRIR